MMPHHAQTVQRETGQKQKINTSVVERHNGTSRLRNQRKVRKTLAFSKSNRYHASMSWLSVVQCNFCRSHGSLRVKGENGIQHQTPAMVSGLTDRIWSTRDWLLYLILGGRDNHRTRPPFENPLQRQTG